jgi:hypothetical protein
VYDFKFYQACIGQKQLVQSWVGLNEVDGKVFLFQSGVGESLVVFSIVSQTWYFYIILIYLIENSEVIFHF